MSEEASESQPEETPVQKCYEVPEDVKPLVECCKKFKQGEIDESTFFADGLVKMGEFMKSVKGQKGT